MISKKKDILKYPKSDFLDNFEKSSNTLNIHNQLAKVAQYFNGILIPASQQLINISTKENRISIYEHLKIGMQIIHDLEIFIRALKQSCELNWGVKLEDWVIIEYGLLKLCSKIHLLSLSLLRTTIKEKDEENPQVIENIMSTLPSSLTKIVNDCIMLQKDIDKIYETIALMSSTNEENKTFVIFNLPYKH